MKDIEKIKSEDLGCQVADANPGNFAIEQEVAAMVGATVPQPTEPSADDARELGAQLLVFLRRALLPIRSALRTAVAAIYAHLDSRCTDYTPAAYASYRPLPSYDPMRPFVPRTLPNLLTALTAFSDRKISNGPDTPDGISLAHAFCGTDNAITELVDNNIGWDMKSMWLTDWFPNLHRLILNCRSIIVPGDSKTWLTMTSDEPIRFPYLKTITGGYYHATMFNVTTPLLDLSALETTNQCRFGGKYDAIDLSNFKHVDNYWAYQDLITSSTLRHLVMPKFDKLASNYHYDTAMIRAAKLEDITMPIWDGAYANQCDVLAKNCPELLWIDLSACKTHAWHTAVDCAKLQWVRFGKMTTFTRGAKGGGNDNVEWRGCVNLIKIELGEGSACNIDLGTWEPTTALANNLQQFLSNFRDYIADRLADRTGQTSLTLTLSQTVRDAIHAAETTYHIEDIIVNQKHWTLSPAPSA